MSFTCTKQWWPSIKGAVWPIRHEEALLFFLRNHQWITCSKFPSLKRSAPAFHTNVAVGKKRKEKKQRAVLVCCDCILSGALQRSVSTCRFRRMGENKASGSSKEFRSDAAKAQDCPLKSVSNAETFFSTCTFHATQASVQLQYHCKIKTKNQHLNLKTFHQMSVKIGKSEEQKEDWNSLSLDCKQIKVFIMKSTTCRCTCSPPGATNKAHSRTDEDHMKRFGDFLAGNSRMSWYRSATESIGADERTEKGTVASGWQREISWEPLCWLKVGQVHQTFSFSSSSSSSFSSSSLGLVFPLACERHFTGYRRADGGDATGHGRHAAFHQPHPHRGHCGHSGLCDLQAFASNPSHSTHSGPNDALGDIEEATGHSPHHARRSCRVLFPRIWKWSHKQLDDFEIVFIN